MTANLFDACFDKVQIEKSRPRFDEDKFYVECEADPDRNGNYVPSGLSVSTAEAWAFEVGDTGVVVVVPTDRLRTLVKPQAWGKAAAERDGSCPTRGRLFEFFHFISVMADPTIKALERKAS